ncbi:AAA family ATPase [Cyanobium gracile UHCC 0139]|uniref:AAA family ATPase n=1 Tax=Cyanobium gracile UHCC 0139 TaxID=3110308 RepID=A0ABU5RU40_9CYAN|nr:AAA family ATPase [Cyanobium gracile]MEA5391293.1 AAA family ATPase [Cyanobium gracile UHCC 0139]
MRIQTIEITNYKAFLGTHKIEVGGKNAFIYGENGSGKSSLYYALKDFFQSSMEDIDLTNLENVFVPAGKEGKTAVRVTFKPNHQRQNKKKSYLFNAAINDARDPSDTSIRDGNRLKSFLTYKHLLAIHHLKKDEEINLFDLLVKGVLKHFKYSLTRGKELGELWADVEETIARSTGKEYPINKKKGDVNAAIKAFNEAFGELFKPESPEYILRHAQPFLDYFSHNLALQLRFAQVRPTDDYLRLNGAQVRVELSYAGKAIDKPHLFLNEARLSAIAISIYLVMIKRHVQGIPCKVLFLDDIFIGLDIANRLPLLTILDNEFPEYQVFITTYDKPWFEHARGFLEQKMADWKTLEFYAQACADGAETPFIMDGTDFFAKAEAHLNRCDYKAAAVYARSAFEKLIRIHCERKSKAVTFKTKLKDYKTEDFWRVVKGDLPATTQADIETYRPLVLNAFSHYNTERHEIKTELIRTIQAIKNLKVELAKL